LAGEAGGAIDGPDEADDPGGSNVSVSATASGIAVTGEIDAFSAPALLGALESNVPPVGDFIVDLAALDFIDGRGLATIVTFGDRLARSGRQLTITGASSMARRIWDICDFDAHPGARLRDTQTCSRSSCAAIFDRTKERHVR
jgi:anti-anti-sigma factor